MQHRPFSADLCGRLAIGAGAFALIAAGLMALAAVGPTGYALPLVILTCVVGFALATGLAVDDHPRAALVMVIALPPLGGLYFAALTQIVVVGAIGGGILVVIGAFAASIAIRTTAPTSSIRTRPAVGQRLTDDRAAA